MRSIFALTARQLCWQICDWVTLGYAFPTFSCTPHICSWPLIRRPRERLASRQALMTIGSVASLTVMFLLAFLIYYRRHRRATFILEDGNDLNISTPEPHLMPVPYCYVQPGPPLAWSSKSANTNLPTTRPKRVSGLSIEPPCYEQAIEDHLGHQPPSNLMCTDCEEAFPFPTFLIQR
jgi:hypothetical protein